jgi:hypothetical protein
MSDNSDEQVIVQHTPVHQREGVFDPRHPAATPFAVAQPAAGVVSDTADAKGQNLAGGPTETEAAQTFSDQREVLAENYQRDLRIGAGLENGSAEPNENTAGEVTDSEAKAAPKTDAKAAAKAKADTSK